MAQPNPKPVRIGIGGPVGSGKTMLVLRLCQWLRGEFGGEVGFIDRTGKAEVIAQMNTEAIYQTEHGIFAVTGLAHMSMNNGLIYKLGKNADGAWTAEKWRALPGAPVFSRLLQDGRIFVSCYGGIVLVSPDGSMKSLTRREALKGPVSRR